MREMIRAGNEVIGVPLQPDEQRYDVGEFVPYFQAFEEFAAAEKRLETNVVRKMLAPNGAAIRLCQAEPVLPS